MKLPEDAARALEKLESAGWESYAVGGCVRDSLLGIEPHDWDLCTAAPPEEMKKVFAGERVIETGLKHGTLTLLAPSGPIEITTFRSESGYSDCRHPDRVSFVRNIHAEICAPVARGGIKIEIRHRFLVGEKVDRAVFPRAAIPVGGKRRKSAAEGRREQRRSKRADAWIFHRQSLSVGKNR